MQPRISPASEAITQRNSTLYDAEPTRHRESQPSIVHSIFLGMHPPPIFVLTNQTGVLRRLLSLYPEAGQRPEAAILRLGLSASERGRYIAHTGGRLAVNLRRREAPAHRASGSSLLLVKVRSLTWTFSGDL
jgi:hypothetical protein